MIERQVLRGFLANVKVVPPLIVTFQFNPKEISDNKAVKYAEAKPKVGNMPGKKYTGGGDRTISFDIQLHGLEQGTDRLNPTPFDNGISTELAKLRSFLYPMADAWTTTSQLFGSAKNCKRLASPPTCIFGFGTRILECWVTSITVKETQFNSLLAPVRANVTINLVVNEEEGSALYELDKQRRNALAALGVQNVSPI
jgi:hypothetical protein